MSIFIVTTIAAVVSVCCACVDCAWRWHLLIALTLLYHEGRISEYNGDQWEQRIEDSV